MDSISTKISKKEERRKNAAAALISFSVVLLTASFLFAVLPQVIVVTEEAPAPPEVPTGVFYLPSGLTLDADVLANPNVDGVVIGADWYDLEPTEGVYEFNETVGPAQTFDDQLAQVEAQAAATGNIKAIRLAIQMGAGGVANCGHKPDWLITKITNAGGKFFTYVDTPSPPCTGTTSTIPVYWDPTLLAAHAALAQAVANHVATGHPLIKIVYVPFANSNTNDWNPGDTSNTSDGITDSFGNSTPQTRWIATLGGYASMEAALLAAGNTTFAAYRTAFPTAFLTTSIGRLPNSTLNPGFTTANKGRNIAEDVINAANVSSPGLVVAQKNNLNGEGVADAPGGTSAWNDLHVLAVPHAAQMVWHAYDDNACASYVDAPYGASRMNAGTGTACLGSTVMLRQAIDTGITYGTKWQEIYELDIKFLDGGNLDPSPGAVSDVIAYGHNNLYIP